MKHFIYLFFLLPLISNAAGTTCELSTDASTGLNYADNSLGNQWYTYTNTSSENLEVTISTVDLTAVDTYVLIYSDCSLIDNITSSDDYSGRQSQVTFEMTPNQSVQILWDDTFTGSNYNWSLTTEILQSKPLCEVANSISAGNHTTDNSNGDVWYSYTNNTRLIQNITISSINLTSLDTYLELYDNCIFSRTDYNDDASDYQSELTFDLQPGESQLFLWGDNYTSGIYDWTLTVNHSIAAVTCSDAIVAYEGTNTANNEFGAQWYTYTNNSNYSQDVTLSTANLTTEDTYVSIYSDCNTLENSNDDFESTPQSELNFTLEAGETYYIKWGDEYTSTSYSWNLSVITNTPAPAPTSVTTFNSEGATLIYPNPSSTGDFNVRSTSSITNISIYHVTGSVVYNGDASKVPTLERGIYLVSITTVNNENNLQTKLIVE